MKTLKNKKLMKKYIELAGTMPSLCATQTELCDALDDLYMQAKEEGMPDSDAEQLKLAFNFFKAIVYKRNKNKDKNKGG